MSTRGMRDSQFELLRIISMFLIVLWHFILNSKLLVHTTGVTNFVLYGIMFFIIIHVNIFILIMGYYQLNSSFKLKKVLFLFVQLGFYNLLINSILYCSGLVKYTNVEYINSILFFNTKSYWYVKCYIIVYCLSPIFNKLISNSDKEFLDKTIFCLILIFSIIPFISGGLFNYHDGLGLTQFILLYFIGAYIRKYDITSEILKRFNVIQKRVIYIGVFIIASVINLSLNCINIVLSSLDSNIFKYVAETITKFCFNYSNPIIIIQSISLFMLFTTFLFKNKVINYISSLTLGVYLIHDNYYLRVNIFKWLGLDKGDLIYGNSIILKVIVLAFVCFVLCLMIDLLRKVIFDLMGKLAVIKYIKNKLYNWTSAILKIS